MEEQKPHESNCLASILLLLYFCCCSLGYSFLFSLSLIRSALFYSQRGQSIAVGYSHGPDVSFFHALVVSHTHSQTDRTFVQLDTLELSSYCALTLRHQILEFLNRPCLNTDISINLTAQKGIHRDTNVFGICIHE